MFNYLEQVSVNTDTQELVNFAQNIDNTTIDFLMAKENVYAWHRKINFFYKVTKEVEHYLLYSSLPYCLNIGTKLKIMHVWPSYPFPEPQDYKGASRLYDYSILPTGNVRPRYMVIGDANDHIRVNRRLFMLETKDQGYFDRAWSRGPAARIMRGALNELLIHTETWYSTILKVSTPLTYVPTLQECALHYSHIVNEIKRIEPENIILVGRNTRHIAKELGLLQLCKNMGMRTYTVNQPDSIIADNEQEKINIYANHLYDVLFK